MCPSSLYTMGCSCILRHIKQCAWGGVIGGWSSGRGHQWVELWEGSLVGGTLGGVISECLQTFIYLIIVYFKPLQQCMEVEPMLFLPSARVMATLSHLRTACLMVTMHQSMQRPLGLCLWPSSSPPLLSILTGSPAGKCTLFMGGV